MELAKSRLDVSLIATGIFIPVGACPHSLSRTLPIFESAFEETALLCPAVLSLAFGLSVDVLPYVLIAIFEVFPSMAMFEKVAEVTLVARLLGFQSTESVYDSEPPLPCIDEIACHQHPIPMLKPIHIPSVVVTEAMHFQSRTILAIIHVLPIVPAFIGSNEQPFPLPQVIFQRAFV